MLNYHLTLFDVKKNTIIFKIEILLYFSNLHKFILYLFYIYICYNWTIINTIKSFIYLRLIKSVRQSAIIYGSSLVPDPPELLTVALREIVGRIPIFVVPPFSLQSIPYLPLINHIMKLLPL